MGCEVVWTDTARDDLRDLVGYIAQDSPKAAARIGGEIGDGVQMLASQPFLGSVYRRSRGREIRETVCRKYRIFYRVLEKPMTVEILTIRHGARREPRFLR
jgi:plasmid stabilization system protein ParE